MTATMNQAVEAFTLSEQDREIARQAGEDIARCLNGRNCYTLEVVQEGNRRIGIRIPAAALSLLQSILSEMGEGNAVTNLPLPVELTAREAAEIMGVPLPYLDKLLDAEEIPFRAVRSHRRIQYADLAAYMDKEKAARKEALKEMIAEAQRLGLYE